MLLGMGSAALCDGDLPTRVQLGLQRAEEKMHRHSFTERAGVGALKRALRRQCGWPLRPGSTQQGHDVKVGGR